MNFFKKTPIYIYAYNANSKKIGIDQAKEIEEFTIDTEVRPDSVETVQLQDIENNIIFMDTNSTALLQKYRTHPKAKFMQRLIQYSDWADRRRILAYQQITKNKYLIRWIINNMPIIYSTDLTYRGVPITADSQRSYNIYTSNQTLCESKLATMPRPPLGYKLGLIALRLSEGGTTFTMTVVCYSFDGSLTSLDFTYHISES